MIDLNAAFASGSSWWLTDANAINSAGQIVGWGRYGSRRDYEMHGFLLSLTP